MKSFIFAIIVSIAFVYISHELSNQFYFNEAEQTLQQKRDEVLQLKARNDEDETIKQNAEQMEAALKEIENRYSSLKPLIPTEAELPRILDWITNRALERGLKLEHFSQGSKLSQQGSIIELPVQVEVAGYYDGVERYLQDFPRFERILKVQSIKLSQQKEQLSAYSTVKATINFSCYFSKAEPTSALKTMLPTAQQAKF